VNNIHIKIDRIIFDNQFDDDLDRKAIGTAIKHNLSLLLTDNSDAIFVGSIGRKNRHNIHYDVATGESANTREDNKSRYFQVSNIVVVSFDICKHDLCSNDIGKKVSSSIFQALTKINRK
jgi:hypothetical protein